MAYIVDDRSNVGIGTPAEEVKFPWWGLAVSVAGTIIAKAL